MATLKTILASLDGVDAAYHDLYTERDGEFTLNVEGIDDHPTVVALRNGHRRSKTERQQALDELAALRQRLEGLPDDFNAEAYEALKEAAEGGGGGDVDARIQQVKDQAERRIQSQLTRHTNELKARDAKTEQMSTQLERTVLDRGLSMAMDEANIDPKHKKMLTPYLRSLGKVKLVEQGGDLVALVDTDLADDVPLAKFVSDWAATDAGKDYVGKPAGLDTKPGDPRRLEGNPFGKTAWNKTDQGRMIRDDRTKAERMAKAAGFSSLDAAGAARDPIRA